MTKVIPILSGRCLVVELPEGANRFTVFNDARPYLSFFVSTETPRVYLPEGNWHLVGMLSEVTEEEAGELVGWVEKAPGLKCFVDYKKGRPTHSLFTSIESLESAILAEGWYFENPHGEDYPEEDDNPMYLYRHVELCKKWEAAQSRVLDRSRCLLLGRGI